MKLFLEKTEGYVHQNLLDKRKKVKPRHKLGNLARFKDNFLKGDATNWSFILHETTETVNYTIPSYRIDSSPEGYNQALLKKDRVINERK